MNIKYERVYVINLPYREDRLKSFRDSYPWEVLGRYTVFPAVDGKECNIPSYYTWGCGGWGCYCSHNNILATCLNEGIDSVLILEDDAHFRGSAGIPIKKFHEALPDDAQWVYYGGQHIHLDKGKPIVINDKVLKPFNVNRTHAYGLIGKDTIERVFDHLQTTKFPRGGHIDHHYGLLHESNELQVYCPQQWIVGQGASKSDIDGQEYGERTWTYIADKTYLVGIGFCGVH